jgi:hypothetical protein
MKRPVLLALAAVLLLAAGAALRPALSQAPRPAVTLYDAWKQVEGRRAAVRFDEHRMVVAVSLRDQVGPSIVESVGADHVVLTADGSEPKWRSVVPLGMVELQVFR